MQHGVISSKYSLLHQLISTDFIDQFACPPVYTMNSLCDPYHCWTELYNFTLWKAINYIIHDYPSVDFNWFHWPLANHLIGMLFGLCDPYLGRTKLYHFSLCKTNVTKCHKQHLYKVNENTTLQHWNGN